MADPLDGITADDFRSWKHHPVTKVYLRYLMDFERELMVKLVDVLRASEAAPDPFQLGMFNGRSSAILEMATLDFSHIAGFYTPPEQEDKQKQED